MKVTNIIVVLEKQKEGTLYLIFGGFTVLVTWITYTIFVLMGIELNTSNMLSWFCAVSFAFVVNKWFVFMSHSLEKAVLVKEAGFFFLLRILTGIIRLVGFWILLDIGLDGPFFGVNGFIALAVVTVLEIVANYFASKLIVFKKKENA
jgi:putative flippase GtrA